MVSRVDRLFILLDTGSNESIRLAAAKQLGEVQRVQPNDLHHLLKRIKEYSQKPVWETRVAAGHATRSVLEHVDPWPNVTKDTRRGVIKKEPNEEQKEDDTKSILNQYADTKQILQNFNLSKIVSACPTLMSMDVVETDDLEASSNKGTKCRKTSSSSTARKNTKEQLMRQRQLINKELGISMTDSLNLGVKSTDIITNDDLQAEYTAEINELSTNSLKLANNQQKDFKQVLDENINNYKLLLHKLREKNLIGDAGKPQDSEDDKKDSSPSANAWPLEDITRLYVTDLFDSSWEIRHGSAIALREIVRAHGRSAGRRTELSDEDNECLNEVWLVDMALYAICVLSLDRFGDFLFDQVVAPVRENVAQLLGCCVSFMHQTTSYHIINIILLMLSDTRWETRHGGVLGLKYSLNVPDKSIIKANLQICFDAIYKCLADLNDDVSAEAAAALVPIKDILTETLPEKTPLLIRFLWDHIANLDELTTSTSNIVLLLAALITSSSAQLHPTELIASIPKLWFLLGHSSTNVRVSVLKALITLIKVQKTSCLDWMPEELLSTALRLVFQRAILENADEVRPLIYDAWNELLRVDTDNLELAQVEQFNLLRSTSQYLNYWLCLTMQPSNVAIDRSNPSWLNIYSDGTKCDTKPDGEIYIGSSTFNVDSFDQQKSQVTQCRLLSTNLLGKLYANLVSSLNHNTSHNLDTLKYLSDMFTHYLRTKSANNRMISSWAIESWARNHNDSCSTLKRPALPSDMDNQMRISIQETNLCYDELASYITRLQHEAREFVNSLVASNIVTNLPHSNQRRIIYNLDQIRTMCDINVENEVTRSLCKKTDESSKIDNHDIKNGEIYSQLMSKQLTLARTYQTTKTSQKNYSTSALSSLAYALVSWRSLPEKLKLITEPLLDSIEIENEISLQDKSIHYLVDLLDSLCRHDDQQENVGDKEDQNQPKQLVDSLLERLISNLSSYMTLQSDSNSTDFHRIIQLDHLQRLAENTRSMSRRQSSINSTSSLKRSYSLTSTSSELDSNLLETNIVSNEIKHRGTSRALKAITRHFGSHIPKKLPYLWSYLTDELTTHVEQLSKSPDDVDSLNRHLLALHCVGDQIHESLRSNLLAVYTHLIKLLSIDNPSIRHNSSQCIGMISKLMFGDVQKALTNQILPLLELDKDPISRCGAIEAVALIIENLQLDLIPKINMFIVHVLRRMSDNNDQVRLMATHCFGKLLSLMPLHLEKSSSTNETKLIFKAEELHAKGDDSVGGFDDELEEECRFIEQLLDLKRLSSYKLLFETRTQLRTYQQEGLNWLAFLNRFNLHGILSDEMGLGKTFMTICMVASDHFNKDKKQPQQTSEKQANNNGSGQCPSLIVCPSTLVEHWLSEIEKFVPSSTLAILNPVAYVGSISDRAYLRSKMLSIFGSSNRNETLVEDKRDVDDAINIIVTSYDVLRNDIDFFRAIHWNYCVLDEGHIIKNTRTKLSRAIRLLCAAHRLILSGTPIQNNVTELWSLFDFLMPGFLGSERQFNVRFAKPILQSREPKCSARELEAGALAMESLHRQVLPFILRRLKQDVLDDLPPKIIQDYYCELSALQLMLYEDFTRSTMCKDVTRKSLNQLNEADDGNNAASLDAKTKSKSHVFQALQYLKNVCNHPKLVLTPKHSQYEEIKKSLATNAANNDGYGGSGGGGSSLDDINHSSKLKALKQLLIDCGIGVANQSAEDSNQHHHHPTHSHQSSSSAGLPPNMQIESIVNQHRALIFCQLRSMVEIIENDLFKLHLSNITYLKLDGSVPPNQRQAIVSRFNNDPSIDVLLLTTQIGGLGLNLTGADTVIFVEHDWNPTRDLQAMDRAHRIGQKKVVNVYRLITKGTLEEKIMGLQKFKTMVSSTVINQDNTGLGSMNVDQLFDLFEEAPPSGRMRTMQTNNTTLDLMSSINNGTYCAKSTTVSGNSDNSTKRHSISSASNAANFIDSLPELWDQQQYDTEYDLSNFVASLKQ